MTHILWIHVFSCWFMTGAIWMVQLLIYPFFKSVGEKEFSALHLFHTRQITWIVAPIMTLELITAIALFLYSTHSLFLWNLVSVALLWLLTAFVNVPTHNKLKFHSESTKNNLVNLNWPRTLIWSLRAIFLFIIILFEPYQEVL